MNKDNIRLIGLDLDGTLLHDDKSISDDTKEYLEHLASLGIEIVPITGRPIKGIPNKIRGIKGINYVITSNGAQIIDNKRDTSIYSFAMDNQLSNSVIDTVMTFGCRFEAFCDGVGYCDFEGYEYYKNTYFGTPVWDYIKISRFCVDSIKDKFCNTHLMADEIFIVCENSQQRIEISQKLKEYKNIQFCFLGDKFLEITKLGTDKGNALEVLCSHLGIDTKSTIAFGDGENDVEFLSKAGYAIAMENAHPSIKAMANQITDTNNNDGVLKMLKQIFD